MVDDRQQNPEEGGHDNTDHQSPAPPVSRVPTGTNLPPPQTRNPSQYGKRNCDKIQPHVPRTITHRKNIGNPQHDNPADSSDDSDDEAVEGSATVLLLRCVLTCRHRCASVALARLKVDGEGVRASAAAILATAAGAIRNISSDSFRGFRFDFLRRLHANFRPVKEELCYWRIRSRYPVRWDAVSPDIVMITHMLTAELNAHDACRHTERPFRVRKRITYEGTS